MPDAQFRFNKRNIEALSAAQAGKRESYRDSEMPGLFVRVTATGAKSFVFYRRIHGRPERVTLGQFPGVTVDNARKLCAKLNGEVAADKNPAAVRRASRDETTLADLWHIWTRAKIDAGKAKTLAASERRFKQHLKRLHNRKLSQIDRGHVETLHANLGAKSGPYEANRTLALISSMFAVAWKKNLHSYDNPARGIDRFRERSRERFLQADEAPRFFRALAEEENPDIRDYLLLALLTGARKSNLLAMRWDQIRLERETWTIPDTKNGEPVTLPLVGQAVQILRQRRNWHGASEWVFPSSSESGHLKDPKTGWKRVLQRAGITDLRMHDLRRSMGSWQAAQGASLTVIGKSLGHKSLQSTQVYARLNLDPVRHSMTRAADAMYTAAGEPGSNLISLDEAKQRRGEPEST